MPRTLTLDEAAAMLHTCTDTVSECIRSRGLPAVKIGRAWVLVDDDVIGWVRSQYNREDTPCDYSVAEKTVRGTLQAPSQASALRAALAPRTERRRRPAPSC